MLLIIKQKYFTLLKTKFIVLFSHMAWSLANQLKIRVGIPFLQKLSIKITMNTILDLFDALYNFYLINSVYSHLITQMLSVFKISS